MKIQLLLLILFAGAGFQGFAQAKSSHQTDSMPPTRQAFFHQLNSPFMEVIEEGSPYFDEKLGDYPLLARLIQLDIFKWDPDGKPKHLPEDCDPLLWQGRTLDKNLDSQAWTLELEEFVKRCSSQWETRWKGLLSNALGTVNLKLHPSRYPYGRHVIFHLPHHTELKGLLAMKPDGKKRPLLIFRTGIFSNTQEFYPERFLFFQLFEQSPFNVLVLESLSGSEYLKHNDSYSLGGFDEGLQQFLIAQKLQSPEEPLSKFIDSVHMMGMSLGGHGVLFAALLNQLNPGRDGKQVMQSALTFCPLLNMQETLDYHKSQGFSMDLMNYWASRRLQTARKKWPQLQDENFVPQFFDLIQKNYESPLVAENGRITGIKLPKEIENILAEIKRPPDLFWQLNNYWPWYLKVQTPVLMFSTRKDPIVSWFINAGRLEDGRMKFENSNVKMLSFPQGYHCSFPVAYDWGAMATVFQTPIFKFSPTFKQESKEVRVPLSVSVLKFLSEKKTVLNLKFEIEEQTAALFTTVRFDPETGSAFWSWWKSPRMTAQLPLSEMEFPIDQVVRSKDEVSLLRRWAYQNVHAKVDGSDLVFSWKVTAP
jgi:hypothetical protein